MTTIQMTTTEDIKPCKTCGKTPKVSHVDDRGRTIFSVGCCGLHRTNQFLTIAFDSWNFDAKTF